MITDLAVPLSLVKIVGSKIAIRDAPGKDMIDGDEKNASNGDDSAFGASASGQTSVPLSKIRISFSGCTPGRLGEDAAKPAISLADVRASPLASAFVVTWANARPGSQVIGRGELGHIGTNFGD